MLAIVLAFLNLLHPPLGTAIGIYTLWVLLPAASEAEWQRTARRAVQAVGRYSPCSARTFFSTGSSSPISTPMGAVLRSAKRRALTITRLSSEPTALL